MRATVPDESITDEAPDSAATGRTMDEIARRNGPRLEVGRDRAEMPAQKSRRAAVKQSIVPEPASRRKSVARPAFDLTRAFLGSDFPALSRPNWRSRQRSSPRAMDWVHELKLDGYRIQIQIRPDRETQKRKDTSPAVDAQRSRLDCSHARHRGCAVQVSTSRAQFWMAKPSHSTTAESAISPICRQPFMRAVQHYITYFAFDLLHLNGHNLRGLPLTYRKANSRAVIAKRRRRTALCDSAKESTVMARGLRESLCARCGRDCLEARHPPSTLQAGAAPGSNSNAVLSRSSSSADLPCRRKARSGLAHCCWATTRAEICAMQGARERDSRRRPTKSLRARLDRLEAKNLRSPMFRARCSVARIGSSRNSLRRSRFPHGRATTSCGRRHSKVCAKTSPRSEVVRESAVADGEAIALDRRRSRKRNNRVRRRSEKRHDNEDDRLWRSRILTRCWIRKAE